MTCISKTLSWRTKVRMRTQDSAPTSRGKTVPLFFKEGTLVTLFQNFLELW